jgi:CheY-like chemotaxis protein
MSHPTVLLLAHGALLVRHVYRLALEGAGYHVVETWDGDDAMMLLAKRRPALVVTDLYLESVDDECLLRRLRAHPAGASLPVVVVSAQRDAVTLATARREGASAFVPLPALPSTLLRAVHRCLDAHAPPPERLH